MTIISFFLQLQHLTESFYFHQSSKCNTLAQIFCNCLHKERLKEHSQETWMMILQKLIHNYIQMNEQITYNPIISQLKILKQKLNQKNKIISILGECIKNQEKALFTIVSQFQQHESKIMRRLHKLEQINLRYINNYLEVKKQYKTEDFVAINHMFATDAKSFITKKIESIKTNQSQQSKVMNAQTQSKKMVNNCLNLMKDYLSERKVNYQKCVTVLSQQRKRKMKQSKGLEAYKQNKQQAKFIEELNKKIKDFDKKSTSIDDSNAVEIFHRRQQIEGNISRLDPSKGQITIQDSQMQQKMFQQIIQQIVTTNDSQQIQNYFLQGSFNFIQDKVQILSEIYGVQFVNQSIQSIQNLSSEEKVNIINNNYSKSKKSLNFIHGIPSQTQINRQKQSNQQNQTQKLEGNIGGKESFKKIKTRKQIGQQMGQGQQQQIEDDQQNQEFSIASISKIRKNKQQKANTKLENKFQKTLAKSFFQQQDKKRDELIDKQKGEIVQHSKVIDKLITFIKKQFKQRKLDDIDADDPQQLIGYYFKVNEKKYGDIREQMKEVQTLQKETAKINNQLTFKNQELNIKVNELQIQMEQLLKKYERSSFELHILISRTQDLVKISLQTLINTCMKSITPQELINQLEKIIERIKENLQSKRNMIYKFTIQSEIILNNQEKIQREEYISLNKDNYSAITEQLQEIRGLQVDNKVKSQIYDGKIEPIKQKSEISQSVYVPLQKRQQVEPSQLQEPQLLKIQSNISRLGQKSFGQSEGFDQKYINKIRQKIEIIKDKNFNNQDYDMNQMYSKYKQALMCLQRAENINRQHQIKYQNFIDGLKKTRAWECPQKLQQKLFYMQKLIAEQNQLLQNQREEYEQTILTQVQQSERLAQNIIKKFKLTKKESKK